MTKNIRLRLRQLSKLVLLNRYVHKYAVQKFCLIHSSYSRFHFCFPKKLFAQCTSKNKFASRIKAKQIYAALSGKSFIASQLFDERMVLIQYNFAMTAILYSATAFAKKC